MAKYKKMTNREKKYRADLKKEMQEKGILPPDKPRLNRKKFIEEAMDEWAKKPKCYIWDVYLRSAITYMLAQTERRGRASPEAIGAAKILKLAIRLREFNEKSKKEGVNEYKLTDEYEYVRDILEA